MNNQKCIEDFTNVLREILRAPSNRFCFECGQRGPTYVNITDGSFCCTHCSGLLRGLNPPRRVKSISLSVFTREEIEKLKKLGNEENSKIWLGLCDSKIKFDPRIGNEVRQHLIQKYEEKRWYISPDELAEQKRLLESITINRRDSVSSVSVQSTKSNKSAPPILHAANNLTPVDLLTGDLFEFPKDHITASQPITRPTSATPANIDLKNIFDFKKMSQTGAEDSMTNETTALSEKKELNLSTSNTKSSDIEGIMVKPDRNINTTADQKAANFEIWNPPSQNLNSEKQLNGKQQNQEQRPIALLSDGRPVISKHEELPDYSAFEELFRGTSLNSGIEAETLGYNRTIGSDSKALGWTGMVPAKPIPKNDSFSMAVSNDPTSERSNQNPSWNPFL